MQLVPLLGLGLSLATPAVVSAQVRRRHQPEVPHGTPTIAAARAKRPIGTKRIGNAWLLAATYVLTTLDPKALKGEHVLVVCREGWFMVHPKGMPMPSNSVVVSALDPSVDAIGLAASIQRTFLELAGEGAR